MKQNGFIVVSLTCWIATTATTTTTRMTSTMPLGIGIASNIPCILMIMKNQVTQLHRDQQWLLLINNNNILTTLPTTLNCLQECICDKNRMDTVHITYSLSSMAMETCQCTIKSNLLSSHHIGMIIIIYIIYIYRLEGGLPWIISNGPQRLDPRYSLL